MLNTLIFRERSQLPLHYFALHQELLTDNVHT